jgi:DNA-binding transcriptional regulator YiaG
MTPFEYKAARELRGSQTVIAAALGVRQATVSDRENGHLTITTEAALALLALPKKRKKREV